MIYGIDYETGTMSGLSGATIQSRPSLSTVAMINNTQTGDPTPVPITVVLNWTAGLKK